MNEPVRILQWGMGPNLGGVDCLMMDIYRHIDRSKVQFDFLCDHDADKLAFEDEMLALGGRVFRVMVSQHQSMMKSRTALMSFFRDHPEIQGIHVNANFPYALPLKYAAENGVQLRILHSHNAGTAASHDHDDLAHTLIWCLREWQTRHQISRYPNLYCACSKAAAEYMFPGKPFTWVRNGINTVHFAYDEVVRSATRAELHIAPSTSVIGFCGRFRTQKNPLFLLDVFAEYHRMVPDSLLMLVGIGELRSLMDERIEQLGLKDSVLYMGWQRHLSPYYQAMDAFLLPSLYEGLGIVYVEAQCAGLPCFASADAVPPEAKVTDLLHYVSLKESAEQWAHEMRDALEKTGERQNSADDVRAAGYDIRDVAARLQDLYLNRAGRA